MKNFTLNLKHSISLFLLLMIVACGYSQEGTPFNCDYSAYLFQYNDVYSIDLASGSSFLVASDVTPGNINAAAYNPADGYLWGSLSSPAKTIVRIGKDFSTTNFYVDELPTNNRYVGDISPDGVYYLKGGGTTYYRLDLDPNSATYSQHLSTESLSQGISIHDWAFNAVDGLLYAVEKHTNILYRIDPSNGQIMSLGEVPILSGLNYTYGAVYFDASGRFYVSANQTGTVYVIKTVQELDGTNAIYSNLFAFGPSSSSNDGARCPTAPVIQEICFNGIDDDGDGLTDCEDPSCSGYGECDVIEPPTSGSNDGGLESNNRLSEQINKRNFDRAKTGYKFDRSAAKRVLRSQSYAQRSPDSNFALQDFIPMDIINEDEVIDATPLDLLNITNAIDIYGVDYLVNNTPVASILALKTENGVYEHTKYICDRLLGAELISVSTIEINGQSFIKSIIKNTDGTFEFVLSLSAKVIDNDTSFGIESHWNLDQYEQDVTFYNFQIWSNSLDDLFLLGEEVLNLLNVEKPIATYDNSTPPTVFVRKGKYMNGALDLQIINTNSTEAVTFDAGYRATETSDFDNTTAILNLNANYITNLQVQTGNLFDIGFRIGDGIATPDDLFMSDGPWGIDDSQANTIVNNYTISPNESIFDTNDFPIERNLILNATTSTYFAAYRAITPRFKAVDLTDYNSFKLKAKGTGSLEVTFVKQSISNWESQYRTTITLDNDVQEFEIPFSNFIAGNGASIVPDDIVTIVFTMISEDGSAVTKEMNLQDIRFSQANTLSINGIHKVTNTLSAFPNPMSANTNIRFNSNLVENLNVVVYNQIGQVVHQITYNTNIGKNSIELKRQNLNPGLYFIKIIGSQNQFNPLKLLIK